MATPLPPRHPMNTRQTHAAATSVAFEDGSQYTVTNGVIGAQTRPPG